MVRGALRRLLLLAAETYLFGPAMLCHAAGLGESRLRDLNDEINKLLRELHHWNRRIKELGGPDHSRSGGSMFAADGRELPHSRGYRYFGAAKDLPGVRELFTDAAPKRPKRTRGQMFAAITPDYFGFRDEDDGTLVPAEREAEAAQRQAAVEAWEAKDSAAKKARRELLQSASKGAKLVVAGGEAVPVSAAASAVSDPTLRAHVPVPSQEVVSKLVLERKKRMLLDKYASSSLQGSEQTAKGLMNAK